MTEGMGSCGMEEDQLEGGRVESDNEFEKRVKKDVLFFDSPIHTKVPDDGLIKDSGQNIDLPRGMLSISSSLEHSDNPVSSSVIPLDAYLYKRKSEFVTDGKFDQEKYMKAIYGVMDGKINEADPKALAFGLMYTFVEPTVLAMTRHAKEKNPDKYVVVGGNHATFNDLDLLGPENLTEAKPEELTGIDIVVRFEGEETMKELMAELSRPNPDLSKILGISYRDENGKRRQNGPRKRADLYSLPPLDYDLVDTPESLDKFNHTAMLLRGCRGNCAFCTSPNYWNQKLSTGRADNFQQEIEYLAKNGVEMVSVLDDDILASDEGFELIMSSLRKVKEKYPDLKFIAQTRVKHLIDKNECGDKLDQMKEVGISRLYVGIESGSQVILNEMSKGSNTKWIENALVNIHEAGIETGGFWLFGHPGATLAEEEKSLQFMEDLLQKNLLDDVEAHAVVPFPGTRIAADSRIGNIGTNKEQYGVINNDPIYDLIDPASGEIILSKEKIGEFLNRSSELRKKYLDVDKDLANRPV